MILVTGATGHIGNVLVRQLLEGGEQVRALVWKEEDVVPLQGLDVDMVAGDVLDLDSLWEAFRGVRSVFHLAGLISILPGTNPLVRKVNLEGTKNVITAAVQSGVERFIYTSSIHALARVPSGVVIDEKVPYDPQTPFGEYDRSKAEATLEVLEATKNGLNAVIVCPTGVIGPFDYRLSEMGSLIHAAAKRKPTLYVDGAYDFVDVRDVADGLIRASKYGQFGESYILSGQQISTRFLLETIREITGRAYLKIRIPFDLARLAAPLASLYYRLANLKPIFTPYALEVLRSNSVISHAKASRDLAYHPRPLYDSIADTIRWFLEHRQAAVLDP